VCCNLFGVDERGRAGRGRTTFCGGDVKLEVAGGIDRQFLREVLKIF